jgi:hypothetical protein
MVQQSDNPYEAYAPKANEDGVKKFSDELLYKLKGKLLELYIGDQAETITYEEYSVPQNCIIYGKLVDIFDRFVVLDCYFVDGRTKQVANGNIVYINSFQIRAMTELNANGSLNDIFLDAKSSEKIRKTILSHHSNK